MKFAQHPELREALVKTVGKRLVEATRDPYFGAGETLQTIGARIDTFKGANKLGSILAGIRDSYTKNRTKKIKTKKGTVDRKVKTKTVTVVAPEVTVDLKADSDSDSDTGTIVPAPGKNSTTTNHRTDTSEESASAESSEGEDN